jgi:transposase-like protein
MTYVPPEFDGLDEIAGIDMERLTEDEARAILEGILWPNGPVCPHCNSRHVTRIAATSRKVSDGLIQCNECRGQFTVRVKTVMHRSHMTLRQWVQALHFMCFSEEKPVSALQLQKYLGLTSYRSACRLAKSIKSVTDKWKPPTAVDKELTNRRSTVNHDGAKQSVVSAAHARKEDRPNQLAANKQDEDGDLEWFFQDMARKGIRLFTPREFLSKYRNQLNGVHRAIFDDVVLNTHQAKKLLPIRKYYEAKKIYRSLIRLVLKIE